MATQHEKEKKEKEENYDLTGHFNFAETPDISTLA